MTPELSKNWTILNKPTATNIHHDHNFANNKTAIIKSLLNTINFEAILE